MIVDLEQAGNAGLGMKELTTGRYAPAYIKERNGRAERGWGEVGQYVD